MHTKDDPYTYFDTFALLANSIAVGTAQREYSAKLYDDVRMCDINAVGTAKSSRKYRLELTQRVRVCNTSSIAFAESAAVYQDYPVLLTAVLEIDNTNAITTLLSYSPRTLNAKVETAGSQADQNGTTQSVALGSSSGSSQTQTNSYGASVSVGMDGPSASANYEHSSASTSEQSSSTTNDSGHSSGRDVSNSATMSIKDWGAYALVNPDQTLLWTFGQEYPWDVIQFRQFTGQQASQQQLEVPQAVLARLYDSVTNSLYPPSHLSVFGFDFVMKSMWLVEVPNGDLETLDVLSQLSYYTASHSTTPNPNGSTPPEVAIVSRDVNPTALQTASSTQLTTTVDLALLALDPVGTNGDTAIVGFVANRFNILPSVVTASGQSAFAIPSPTNHLIVRDISNYAGASAPDVGAGFTATDSGLIANFTPNQTPLVMRFHFKITNTHQDYTLFLKHWKLSDTTIQLSIAINGTGLMTRIVDAYEAEGGESNLTTIKLRDLSFGTIDFHDYLQLGLNTVDITILPATAPTAATPCYQLLAASIERS